MLLDVIQETITDKPSFFIPHFLLTIPLEAGVLMLFAYNEKFGTCLRDALIVNIVSFAVGLLVFIPFNILSSDLDFRAGRADEKFILLLLMFLPTILIEGILLRLLNKAISWKRIVFADLIMNFLTYCLFYFILLFFNF